ncbi:MAG TPA: EAL domain-containing protein [Casimicrobiaceae bacterium]|nr:EAL domain-containing protein [Casimicrobiaceae bacterium]
MSRRLRVYLAIAVGVIAAGVPAAMILRGLDAYIERQASDEVRLAAQRTMARFEWRIGQAIEALETIGEKGLASCADIDPELLRRAVMRTTPIKEVAVVDASGSPRCLPSANAQMRALSRELRTADDRVLLQVIRPSEREGRALRLIWRRRNDPLHLLAYIPADVFLPDGASNAAASNPVVRVLLEEGTLIAARDDTETSVLAEGDAITAQNASTRYPVIVTAAVSRSAVFADRADLRAVGLLGSAVLAVLMIALAVLLTWRARVNPVIEMERALEEHEFVPFYQPLVDLRTGAIGGAEVLMRWRKPDGSLVPPAMFIPLAESSGLILQMTEAIMVAVRDELAQFLAARPRFRVSFNLTAEHFKNKTIVRDVREIFAPSPIRLSQIVLELTERQALEDLDTARDVIAALQELGCKVAIDDVGTGHGGLSYMLKLGVNYIKIDKMFIDAIGSERYSRTIIETLIDLARKLRMAIVAEGVETFEQVQYLRERGVQLAQGYVFAPPLPGPQFRQLVEAVQPGTTPAAIPPESAVAIGRFMAARDRVAAA